MALILADRVKETTSVVGTGTLTLLGAVIGFQAFSTIGNGNTCYYAIASKDGTYWETGIGTYSGTTLARTTVLSSSNAGALVSFIAGVKEVFITYPASKSVFTDSVGCVNTVGASPYPTIRPSLNLDFANSKQLDPRITFSRGTTATYYDGKTVAKAEENLLTYSQGAMNSGYFVRGCTQAINTAIAPDGTLTAETLTASAFGIVYSPGLYRVTTVVVTVNNTFSIYAKAGAANWVTLSHAGASTGWAYFDLTPGALTPIGFSAGCTPTISDVGNGWYRCAITNSTFSGNSNALIAIKVSNANAEPWNTQQTYEGTESIYVWGAQLEQRSQATAYTPTTTSPITNYIPQLMTAPAGVARFDHEPLTGKSLGLLIEESRINLLTYSQTLSLTQATTEQYWIDTTITRTLSAYIGADGTQSGVQFTATAANANTKVSVAQGTSAARTLSVLLKRISGTGVINYTLDNGVTWIAQAITSTLTRYYFPTTTAAQQVGFQIVTSGDSIGIWGAQLEAGSFATSYIPTTTGVVTRLADQASMTGVNFSSWYNQSEGSFVYNAIAQFGGSDANERNIFGLGNSTNNNTFARLATYQFRRFYTQPTLNEIGLTYTSKSLVGAVSYEASSLLCRASLNGTLTNNNTALVFTGVDTIYGKFGIGNSGRLVSDAATGRVTIKKLAYYPKALSNIELQGLTQQ